MSLHAYRVRISTVFAGAVQTEDLVERAFTAADAKTQVEVQHVSDPHFAILSIEPVREACASCGSERHGHGECR